MALLSKSHKKAAAALAAVALAAIACGQASAGVRIKDITDLEGARGNQLYGLGMVVGLEGTGGRSLVTQQLAVDMLFRFQVRSKIAPTERLDNVFRSGNVSAVMVTSELGPYTRKGAKLDVLVSALDDAASLQGGTLILTPLRGADFETYAVAQGPISIGGYLFSSPPGGQSPFASIQKNHNTAGRIPGGAFVEREARGNAICNGRIHFLLRQPDNNTSRGIAKAINAKNPGTAFAIDAGTVEVAIPDSALLDPVAFIGDMENLEVQPDTPAKVVINERTGTIVAGDNVRVSPVALAHGSLAITTDISFYGGLAVPFGGAPGAVLPQFNLETREGSGTFKMIPRSVTVADLARALNALGVTPRDLIAIFQALHRAGALHAELVII